MANLCVLPNVNSTAAHLGIYFTLCRCFKNYKVSFCLISAGLEAAKAAQSFSEFSPKCNDLSINGSSRKVRVQKKTLSTRPVSTACCLITVLGIGCSCQSTNLWDLSFPASNYRTQCLSAVYTPLGSQSHWLLNIKVTVHCTRILQNSCDNLFVILSIVSLRPKHDIYAAGGVFYFLPSRWEMANSEVTIWSTWCPNCCPVWWDNKSHSSKRSAVFGEQESWISTVSNEPQARHCCP